MEARILAEPGADQPQGRSPSHLEGEGAIRYGAPMRFAEADSGGYRIEAYGREGIRVAGRTLTSGIILTPERLIEGWGPTDPAGLDAGHLGPLIDLSPELIVLGTGAVQVFPDPSVYFRVLELRIGFEIMDTGAACRTYNILMAEGRRVAAALLPLTPIVPVKP